VFWFSLRLLQEAFLILRRIKGDNIIIVHRSLRKVLVILVRFSWNWDFSTYVRKILKYQIQWRSVQWEPSSTRTGGQTDMAKLLVAFRNIANAPKSCTFSPHCIYVCVCVCVCMCVCVYIYIYIAREAFDNPLVPRVEYPFSSQNVNFNFVSVDDVCVP
jgi:hypothetical protein